MGLHPGEIIRTYPDIRGGLIKAPLQFQYC